MSRDRIAEAKGMMEIIKEERPILFKVLFVLNYVAFFGVCYGLYVWLS